MSFEEKIKLWLDVDDKIKRLNEETRHLRETKNELAERINIVIDNNKLQDAVVEVPGGKIKFAQTRVTQPVTLKYIETCLSTIIQDQKQVEQIVSKGLARTTSNGGCGSLKREETEARISRSLQ